MLSKLHIHAKDRAYTLSSMSGPIATDLSGDVAEAMIRRNRVTRARRNRVTILLAGGRKAWLTPTNKSRGSAFRICE